MSLAHSQLTGGLFIPDNPPGTISSKLSSAQITEIGRLATGWRHFQLHSDSPLLKEPDIGRQRFTYDFVSRESGNRLMLVATHRDLIDHFFDKIGWRYVRPRINVPGIVQELSENPEQYSMSKLWARIEGFGQAMTSIAIYGRDLSAADPFYTLLPFLGSYRVGLRHVSKHADVLEVSARGDVGFTFVNVGSLRLVDNALRFLSGRGYIEWPDSAMASNRYRNVD